MKTKIYSLRDGKISFNIEMATTDSIAALSPDQMIALVNSGLSNWAYRAGAKDANDGKSFSLGDVATDLLTVKTKDGEPSKDDKEQAGELMQLYRIDAAKVEIDEATKALDEYPGDDSYRLDICRARFLRFISAKTAEFGFDWQDNTYNATNVSEFCRALRLARLRKARKANDLG